VFFIIPVKDYRNRTTFRARPERLTGRGNGVFREIVKELLDFVGKAFLKFEAGPDDAFLEGERTCSD